MAEASKPSNEGQKASKGKLKKPPPFPRKNSDMNSMSIVLTISYLVTIYPHAQALFLLS
jgi:hypothetical protein